MFPDEVDAVCGAFFHGFQSLFIIWGTITIIFTGGEIVLDGENF